jgi:hypothetical protein
MLQDIGVPVEKTSPHPFLLTDGAREVRVEPDRLVSYGHPHSLHVSEKHRHWDHPPPVRQQVVRLVPELAGFGTTNYIDADMRGPEAIVRRPARCWISAGPVAPMSWGCSPHR